MSFEFDSTIKIVAYIFGISFVTMVVFHLFLDPYVIVPLFMKYKQYRRKKGEQIADTKRAE